ncbi:hypothetical protein C2845_PM17G14870 [Panicum miliaceum]|uniref:Uncharacterized protein n=1 Tax=Panicum miliaceum TaxID=4540 RepID=A0A3L6Q4H7_PANMI|nr:hypothetical protein C2845_PM17G14870 [Panicum miliaceum]
MHTICSMLYLQGALMRNADLLLEQILDSEITFMAFLYLCRGTCVKTCVDTMRAVHSIAAAVCLILVLMSWHPPTPPVLLKRRYAMQPWTHNMCRQVVRPIMPKQVRQQVRQIRLQEGEFHALLLLVEGGDPKQQPHPCPDANPGPPAPNHMKMD